MGSCLVDNAGGGELLRLWIFNVTKAQKEVLLLAGSQLKMKLHSANRRPAVSNAAGAAAGKNGLRPGRAAVDAQEGVTCGVKACDLPVVPQDRVVIPALPVLSFMVDGAALHLHLTDGVIALEVGGIVHGVPQAELHIWKHVYCPGLCAVVFHRDSLKQAMVAPGYQKFLPGRDSVFSALNDAVSHAVTAGVAVQLCLGRLPADVPDGPAVPNVYMIAVCVQGTGVIAVTGQTAESGILIKGISACGIRQNGKKLLTAQVVDPRQGRAGSGDHIFFLRVIKISELHRRPPKQTFTKTISKTFILF